MRITKRQLRRLIKEELSYLHEESSMDAPDGDADADDADADAEGEGEGDEDDAESKAALRLKLIDLAKSLPKASGITKVEVQKLDALITSLLNAANSGNLASGQLATLLDRTQDKLSDF